MPSKNYSGHAREPVAGLNHGIGESVESYFGVCASFVRDLNRTITRQGTDDCVTEITPSPSNAHGSRVIGADQA